MSSGGGWWGEFRGWMVEICSIFDVYYLLQQFARGVFATKASYVCHGNLSHILWRDQLLADVSLKS